MTLRERILHRGGLPLPVDPRRQAQKSPDRDEARRNAVQGAPAPALPGTNVPEEGDALPDGQGDLEAFDQEQPPQADFGAGDFPASEGPPGAALVEQLLERMDRREAQHRDDIAQLSERFTRQLLAVTGTRRPAAAEAEDIDPDLDPGRALALTRQQLEARMARLEAQSSRGDPMARNAVVRTHVDRLLGRKDSPFNGKPRVAAMVAERVMQRLFDPASGVTTSNWQEHAAREIAQQERSMARELGMAPRPSRAAQVANQVRANGRALPTQRGAATPRPASAVQRPADWGQRDARRQFFDQVMAAEDAGQG